MAIDLKVEQHRKFVANMLAMRALAPIWDDISEDQFGKIHDALSVALEEVSRMMLTSSPFGISVYREPGTPEQEAGDAAKIKRIQEAIDGD